MALPIPDYVLAWVAEATSDPELQAWVLAIAGAESTWTADAKACNEYGCDWGLYQYHKGGVAGMGDSYTHAQLLDGRYMTFEIVRYFEGKRSRGIDLWTATQPWVTRDVNSGLGTVPELARRIKDEGWVPIGGGGSGSQPAAGTPAPGAGSPSLPGGAAWLPLLLVGALIWGLADD